VPLNIADDLTPLALAVWIMDSGPVNSSGMRFSTHGFTKHEVELLGSVLLGKFGLVTSLHGPSKVKDQYYIYIPKESMPLLSSLVKPLMHHSMHYKLNGS
jgi:hypothetical protein